METKTIKQDLSQAKQFCELIAKKSLQTFQWFKDNDGSEKTVFAGHESAELEALKDKLIQTNNDGGGIFLMINEGDGKGRAAENVTEVRACFLDLDGTPLDVIKNFIKPNIIVETSPERYHCYWTMDDCPLEEFEATQKLLANIFKGDKSVHDLCRVMRLPGFIHCKKTPFLTRILETNEHKVNHTEFIAVLKQLDSEKELKEQGKGETHLGINAYRNNTLFSIGTSLIKKNLSDDTIARIIKHINKHDCSSPLETQELEGIIKSIRNYRDGWIQPVPVVTKLPDVESLPLESLPEIIQSYAKDCAERMQAPIDYIVVGIIVTIASVIGNRISIRPKEKDNWVVIPNLWGLIVGTPSSMKSPTLEEVTSFIKRLECESREEHAKTLEEATSVLRQKTEELKKAKSFLNSIEKEKIKAELKMDNSSEHYNRLQTLEEKASELSMEIEELESEVINAEGSISDLDRYYVTDITPEKLQEMLRDFPHGLMAYFDELSYLFALFNKPGFDT